MRTGLPRPHRLIQPVLDLRDGMIAAGLPVEIVSTGETWSYDIAGDMPEVTEIQGGSYLVMETSYDYMQDFHLAGKVLSSIISVPRPGTAIGDAGARAVCGIKGLPRVEGRPGVEAVDMDADRTVFRVAEGAELAIGDQVILLPGPAGRHGQPMGSFHRHTRRSGRGRFGTSRRGVATTREGSMTATHVVDHIHDQPMSEVALRSVAIEALLAEKGLLTADEVRRQVDLMGRAYAGGRREGSGESVDRSGFQSSPAFRRAFGAR